MQFFPHGTDAYIRVAKRYLVTARHSSSAFDKMDLVLDGEFDFAEGTDFAG